MVIERWSFVGTAIMGTCVFHSLPDHALCRSGLDISDGGGLNFEALSVIVFPLS